MAYMVKWGPKGFLVSPSKVVPFDGFFHRHEAESRQRE